MIGTWRCRPSDPEFPGGWIEFPTIVFPRTCVQIHQDSEYIVADANHVVLYRGNQEYSRTAVDPAGDRCEWFEVDPRWIREAAQPFDPAVAESDTSPIRHTHARATSESYLLQRMLTRLVSLEMCPDPLLVEEALLRLVDLVISSAYRRGQESPRRTTRIHEAIVSDAEIYMGTHFSERLTLASIGRAVGASPYHFARLFRQVTGSTVHRYLNDLRLRAALDELDTGNSNVGDVAVALGFADNSHLTKLFRNRFGLTPSQYRRSHQDHLRSILIA